VELYFLFKNKLCHAGHFADNVLAFIHLKSC